MTLGSNEALLAGMRSLGMSMIGGQSASNSSGVLSARTSPVPSALVEYVSVPPGATAVMPRLRDLRDLTIYGVVNNGTNPLTVFGYADQFTPGESINGTASTWGGNTGGLTVPAGQSAVLLPLGLPSRRDAVSGPSGPLGWSAQIFA
jgi:hypothetical protein